MGGHVVGKRTSMKTNKKILPLLLILLVLTICVSLTIGKYSHYQRCAPFPYSRHWHSHNASRTFAARDALLPSRFQSSRTKA
jgi:hypothetical protein